MGGMARKARIQYPGALYHDFNRGIDRRDHFWDDRDRFYFLDSLALSVDRSVDAYYPMGEPRQIARWAEAHERLPLRMCTPFTAG